MNENNISLDTLFEALFSMPDFDDMGKRAEKIFNTLDGLNIIEAQTVLCSVIDAFAEKSGIDKVEIATNIAGAIFTRAGITE